MRALHKYLHLQPYLNNKIKNNKPEFVHLLQQCCHQVKDGWEKTEPHTGCDNDEELSFEVQIYGKNIQFCLYSFEGFWRSQIQHKSDQSSNIFFFSLYFICGHRSNFSSHSWMTSGLGQRLIDRKGGEGPTQECRLLPCDLHHHHHHHHRWL